MKNLCGIMLLASVFIGCSKVEDLEKKTDNMEATMERMDRTMNHMDHTMTPMYLQIRQKESEDTRSKQITKLNDVQVNMGAKLTAAKKYFLAFEYQFWTNTGIDDQGYRELMLEDALEEFYRSLVDYHAQYAPISPIHLEEDASNSTKVFYSLAATMHFNNPHQLKMIKSNPQFEKISIYDVIKKALKNYTEDKELDHAQIVVVRGQNLEMTEALINARMNFLVGLALKSLVNKKNMGWKEKLTALLYTISSGRLGSLSLASEFEQQNKVTQKDIHSKLDGALKAKKVLVANNMSVNLDASIRSILINLRKPRGEEVETSSARENAAKVYGLIDKLLEM